MTHLEWAFGAMVTTLLGAPASSVEVPTFQSQLLNFQFQLPANAHPGEAAAGDTWTQVPATHMQHLL